MTRVKMFSIALACAPLALCAQAAPQPQGDVAASADARLSAPRGWSAEGSAKLDAVYADTRRRNLPLDPIARRVAEGSAKGSTEAQILASADRVKVNMQVAQDAMVSAGRPRGMADEVARGAQLMERGVTRVQIETMAMRTPVDRSLVVAFDVVGRLVSHGVPVAKAIAQVQGQIDAQASDATIIALDSRVGGGTTNTNSGTVTPPPASLQGSTKSVPVGIGGVVTGIVKRP